MTQKEFLLNVLPFKDKVYRLAKRLLVSTDEAEDATQELFMKLWNKKEEISSLRSIEAYAMTMTKNFCLDRLKSKQASNLTLVHSNYISNDISVDKKLEIENSVQIVKKLMDKLPEQQRIIIQLRDIEEYDYDEICEIVEMNQTAVRVALSRARKTIREQLLKTHAYGLG
ncbi:MAG TPA: sigma-70 family RNA polymerase sigma factor [Flavobacteriaceae bacterium]|nr:sigma-70 family RNA polymerase sigma factor [Flavobacteriaceae bacterium]